MRQKHLRKIEMSSTKLHRIIYQTFDKLPRNLYVSREAMADQIFKNIVKANKKNE